jgi:hypothetical protein
MQLAATDLCCTERPLLNVCIHTALKVCNSETPNNVDSVCLTALCTKLAKASQQQSLQLQLTVSSAIRQQQLP